MNHPPSLPVADPLVSIGPGSAQGRRRTCATLLLVLPALLAATGCNLSGPLPGRLGAHVARPNRSAVLFICDGLGWTFVERGCREGWLPNIQKRFIAGGSHVDHAAAAVPPITYAALATMLTGFGPEDHTIVGNRWFDPDRACFRNYVDAGHYLDINRDCLSRTIYERLTAPRVSVNIQTALKRGVTRDFANWAPSGVMWYFKAYSGVDRLAGNTLPEVCDWANRNGRWPDLLTCYFPGADTTGHRHGPGSQAYFDAAQKIDVQVGRICDWLKQQGLLETSYLMLVSDHGMVETVPEQRIDLSGLVRYGWGRNATTRTVQNRSAPERRAFFDQYDTVVAYQNGRGAFIYFRSGQGWDVPPTPDEVAAILNAPPAEKQLWHQPGIQLSAYLASDDEALLRSVRGTARVVRRSGVDGVEYVYEPLPDDVLGYLDDPPLAAFVRAGFHSSRAWLRATAAQRIPDLVPHIVPLLHVHQAGEVLLFTAPGYSFVPEHGGHGGIDRDEMLMTFLIAGPGVPAGGTIPVARANDVTPTLLDMLQVPYIENEWTDAISLSKPGVPAQRPHGSAAAPASAEE